jgi:hypothetical protein
MDVLVVLTREHYGLRKIDFLLLHSLQNQRLRSLRKDRRIGFKRGKGKTNGFKKSVDCWTGVVEMLCLQKN